MLTKDLVEDTIDALPVEEFLPHPTLNPTASSANERGKKRPAQGVLKSEFHGVHGPPLQPTYCMLLESLGVKLKVNQARRC